MLTMGPRSFQRDTLSLSRSKGYVQSYSLSNFEDDPIVLDSNLWFNYGQVAELFSKPPTLTAYNFAALRTTAHMYLERS